MVSMFKFVLNVKTAEPFRPKFLFGTSQEKKRLIRTLPKCLILPD